MSWVPQNPLNITPGGDGKQTGFTKIKNEFSSLYGKLTAFISETTGHSHDGTADGGKPINSVNVVNTPAGNIASTNQQAVNAELDGRIGAGCGMKNKIINGGFSVNQRGVSGTVTLATGAYGHDRWKAGASGCTYTFATVNNVTTLTITAGSLQQVIEGVNLKSGNHTLSWAGTAQGKIGAGSYSTSSIAGAVTGGTDLTIEFGTGTLGHVQFEPGNVSTSFEMLDYGDVLRKCQRYGLPIRVNLLGYCSAGQSLITSGLLPVFMRSAPTVLNFVELYQYNRASVSLGVPTNNVYELSVTAIATGMTALTCTAFLSAEL